MNESSRSRLLWIVAGLVAVAIVAVVAYNVGLRAGNGAVVAPFGRTMMDDYYGFGFLGPLVFFLVILGVIAWAFAPRTYGGPYRPTTPAGGVDQLKELSDLHDLGKLSDEEFAAAKRRLLGLWTRRRGGSPVRAE